MAPSPEFTVRGRPPTTIPPMAQSSAGRQLRPVRPLQRHKGLIALTTAAVVASALFTSLAQARVALGCWRADYNDARPHSQLGRRTPSEFAFTFNPRRDLALRYAKGSAPAPVAPTAQQGNPNARSELTAG